MTRAGVMAIDCLKTDRLDLERPNETHWPAFLAFYGSERAQAIGWARLPDQTRDFWSKLGAHWETHGFGWFVLVERISRRPIGMCGPWAPPHMPERELAWSLWETKDEGHGLAFEAATAAHAHAFGSLGWQTAVSYIAPGNHRSATLARRLGARPDGTWATPSGVTASVYRHAPPDALAR